MECSAKDDTNITEMFNAIGEYMHGDNCYQVVRIIIIRRTLQVLSICFEVALFSCYYE